MLNALLLAALALQNPPAPGSAPTEKVAEAYAQFLLAHHLDETEDVDGAIAAFKRAMELDPLAADVPAELAALYLKLNRLDEAQATAEQAIKIAPANREANRVLGMAYASRIDARGDAAQGSRAGDSRAEENVAKAIRCLETAIEGAARESDPNVRATLARLYLRAEQYDKAIEILSDLVRQEPGWQDGPLLLTEAYASAGKNADAIAWLEEQTAEDPRLLPALADFYERERRWNDAANTYEKAVKQAPRSIELRTRYASALLNAGGRANATRARDVLAELTSGRTDARTLYLLSQAQRRAGDAKAAEATARRVIAQNGKSPWGYYALAEALEERHQFQSVVDEIAPVVANAASAGKSAADQSFDTSILLPHLGFAYQELGDYDKAVTTFAEARRRSPKDPNIAGYLVEANIAAKKYTAALDAVKAARAEHPDDLRLTRLEAQALRHTGKGSEGVALLESALKTHADDPMAYISLAQLYVDTERGGDAVRVLQDAQKKFPDDTSVVFELGTAYDKLKRFSDAEGTFQQIIKRDPENAAALNYLGYMLADRGERLDESVGYLQKALQLEPENGSYLDSLGWAYFKSDKLDLAEDNLHRAADQLKTNSVIQEHYGEVLFKLGRFNDAIAAWTRALAGDGSDIDRGEIDKKIRAAKEKINKR
jgi:tetratricopeptide (TPR) repeat protein